MDTTETTETKALENVPVMYVLIRDDMRYENEAVQAGHAVAEYLLNHTPIYKGEMWKNGIMVYLSVKDEMFTELRTIKMPKGYLMWLRKYVYKIKRSLSVIYPFSPFVKDNR